MSLWNSEIINQVIVSITAAAVACMSVDCSTAQLECPPSRSSFRLSNPINLMFSLTPRSTIRVAKCIARFLGQRSELFISRFRKACGNWERKRVAQPALDALVDAEIHSLKILFKTRKLNRYQKRTLTTLTLSIFHQQPHFLSPSRWIFENCFKFQLQFAVSFTFIHTSRFEFFISVEILSCDHPDSGGTSSEAEELLRKFEKSFT